MARISAVIFDLDNVLYDERDYVFAAFRSIARFLSGRSRFSEDEIYAKLVCDFQKKGSMYPWLFNDAVADFGLDQNLIEDILRLYATVDEPLSLFAESENTLLGLRRLGLKLALVTNGGVRVQRNKIRLLGLEKFFDVVVLARETEGGKDKPDPEVYRVALQKLGVGAEAALCVGDNPFTDFWGAKRLGIRTVRLLCGEFSTVHLSEEYEAKVVLSYLGELLGVVERINC
jgi:putative hydrolase of the HAD superfamily